MTPYWRDQLRGQLFSYFMPLYIMVLALISLAVNLQNFIRVTDRAPIE